MNRYGTLTRGGPSKATASTLCQKCLKRDIYECKAVAQERPYVCRPSRTQQLLNPKLLPKLTSDVPEDLLRKKGIAEEQLAKIEVERDRKRGRSEDATGSPGKPNRSRSISSNSSASVATISTNASGSRRINSRNQPKPDLRVSSSKIHMETRENKRRRSTSSDGSFPSDLELNRGGSSMASTRRKIGEHSPLMRGRRRNRTGSEGRHTSCPSNSRSPERTRPRRGSERKPKLGSDNTTGAYNAGPDSRLNRRDTLDANTRRQNVRDGRSTPSRTFRQKRTQSPDAEGDQKVATSSAMRRLRDRTFSSDNLGCRRYSQVDERYGTSVENTERQDRKPIRALRRDRSLSPFSKRLALTQAMNVGS